LVAQAVASLNDIGIDISAEDLTEDGFEATIPIAMQLMQNVMQQEARIQPFLTELAIKTVAEAYGITEDQLREIVPNIGMKQMGEMGNWGDDQPEEEEVGEPDDMMKEFIEKRKTHNALIQGISLNHMTKALALAERELEERVPDLYKKQKALSDLMLLSHYVTPLEMMQQMPVPRQGQSEVEWDEEGNMQASANATMFPILVQEISKAVSEANFAHGLGQEGELSPQQQAQFYKYADNELDEPYYFMMGPKLADTVGAALAKPEVLNAIGNPEDSTGENLAYARAMLSMVPGNDLHAIIKGLSSYSENANAKALDELRQALVDAETRSQM